MPALAARAEVLRLEIAAYTAATVAARLREKQRRYISRLPPSCLEVALAAKERLKKRKRCSEPLALTPP